MSEFDVFLCHNSQDKPEVIKIALQLQKQRLKPWLDIWELPPGVSWQERLEEQIEQIKSAAVFVGSSGFGPWQKREMRAFLSEFVERGIPVIPVLLEDAPKQPRLPIFLRSLTWVDFRHGESNPMGRLIWGITQVKPDNFDSFQVAVNEKLPEVREVKNKFESFTEDLGNGVELEMIAIPGGKFMMGSPIGEGERNEKPQHEVIIEPFYLGKFPVTQAQYRKVMKKSSSSVKGNDRPIESISWEDAEEFCIQLSQQTGNKYRLPTEAEWEYAARAGTNTKYYCGYEITDSLANYGLNVGETTPVGQYQANSFGLFDMFGNVWEWCEDDWHDSYVNAPTNGKAWVSEDSNNKVIRGASWSSDPYNCRSAYRGYENRGFCYHSFSLRVVCVHPRAT